tara:strand:- start:166 stop:369 length:204 start_codon:yes stop_codon:yes gene_type:complete
MDGYGETALIGWIITFMFLGAYLFGVHVGADKEEPLSESEAEVSLQWSRASFIAMTIGIVIWFIVFW